ncbi:MAG: hypothetical protein ACTHXA_08565 [Gulosibacter sp.]|uniref:hypothetical protein n=1 Tax=Gulosibacter sp. TaxID=2817531 RepID=UPI003F8ECAB0
MTTTISSTDLRSRNDLEVVQLLASNDSLNHAARLLAIRRTVRDWHRATRDTPERERALIEYRARRRARSLFINKGANDER